MSGEEKRHIPTSLINVFPTEMDVSDKKVVRDYYDEVASDYVDHGYDVSSYELQLLQSVEVVSGFTVGYKTPKPRAVRNNRFRM